MNRNSLLFISIVLIAVLSWAPMAGADELDRIKADGEMKIAMSMVKFAARVAA